MLRWLKKLSRLTSGESAPTDFRSIEGSDGADAHARSAALARQGDARLSERRPDEATTCFRSAVRIYPRNMEARVKLAAALIQQGRFGDAESELHAALSLDPLRADAHYVLGTALIAQGRIDIGIRELDHALRLKPDFAEASRDLCLALFQNGRIEDATRVADAGLLACPDSVELHFYRGNLHYEERNLEKAIACYRMAVSIRPAFPEAHLNLGRIHSSEGRLDEALEEYFAALATHPDSVDVHLAMGDALQALQRLDEAASSYRRAIALAPEKVTAHARLGRLLQTQRKFEESLRCFSEALAIDPDSADLHSGLGLALEGLGRREDAISRFRRAVALRPDHVDGHLYLGNALLSQGDRSQALACYGEIVRLQPDHGVRHLVAALSGEDTERAPDTYVEELFDNFAERFDSDLVESLKYNVPGYLADAIRKYSGPPPHHWDVLDLGCGTGLAGLSIAPYAGNLVGVDLSANMLAKARARGVYHRLEQSELLAMVRNEKTAAYDLVLAADVFVYLGRLEEIAREVSRILRPGGLFGFSVEALLPSFASGSASGRAEDYRLNPSGRYAHSLEYLNRLAAANQFEIAESRPIASRLEHGTPVDGVLVLWISAGPND